MGAEPGVVTVKPFVSVPDGLEGLVTTTFHWPVAAPLRLNEQVSCPCEITITFVADILAEPCVSFAVAPFTNPEPEIVAERAVPVVPAGGEIPLTVAAGPGVVAVVGTKVGIPPAKSAETRTVCVDELLYIS